MKLTKSQLIDVAIEGNKIGFNRQLEPDRLRELDDATEWKVRYTLPHEHINGKLATPHMRLMFENFASVDVTWERYESLQEVAAS